MLNDAASSPTMRQQPQQQSQQQHATVAAKWRSFNWGERIVNHLTMWNSIARHLLFTVFCFLAYSLFLVCLPPRIYVYCRWLLRVSDVIQMWLREKNMQINCDRHKRIFLVLHTKWFDLQHSQSHLIFCYPNLNPNRSRHLAIMTQFLFPFVCKAVLYIQLMIGVLWVSALGKWKYIVKGEQNIIIISAGAIF